MSEAIENIDRRKFLAIATAAVGGAGVVAATVPFIGSLLPSERAQALGSPVTVDVSRLEPGQMMTVEWRSKPIYILHSTPELLSSLDVSRDQLKDPESVEPQQPEYAANEYRAIRPEYLVLTGICTHLGCAPLYRPEVGPADLGDDWPGGFFCPCHGSKFDFAGRVWRGVPAQLNLVVPPHYYRDDTVLVIGQDGPGVA
jgi:ubiquinol-cytochrome c reductase iron-sulfur subunit